MKKLQIVCAMVFIVIIFCTNVAIAQRFDGHGLANTTAQRERNVTVIEDNATKAVFGTPEEAATVIRGDLTHVSCQQIQDGLYKEIARQLQSDFYPDRRDNYDVGFDPIYTNTDDWKKFCEHYRDGYIKDVSGDLDFIHGDPSKSWASENKAFRIIMTITEKSTGKKAMLFADCLNPIYPAEYGTQVTATTTTNQTGGSYAVPAPMTQTVSVVVNKPNPYEELDNKVVKKNCHISTGGAIAIGAGTVVVVVVVVKYVIPALFPKKKDNSYNNQWVHDSNGSPWPSGSGSNVPNGGTTVINGLRVPMLNFGN